MGCNVGDRLPMTYICKAWRKNVFFMKMWWREPCGSSKIAPRSLLLSSLLCWKVVRGHDCGSATPDIRPKGCRKQRGNDGDQHRDTHHQSLQIIAQVRFEFVNALILSRWWSLIGWSSLEKHSRTKTQHANTFHPSKHHLLYTFIGPTDQEGHQLSQDFQIGSCVYIAWVKPTVGSLTFLDDISTATAQTNDVWISKNDMITSISQLFLFANNKDIPNLQFESPTNIPWVQQCHKNFVVTCMNISDNTTWNKGIKQTRYFRIVEIWQIAQLWRDTKSDCLLAEIVGMCFESVLLSKKNKDSFSTTSLNRTKKKYVFSSWGEVFVSFFPSAFNFLCSCICSCKILRKPVQVVDEKSMWFMWFFCCTPKKKKQGEKHNSAHNFLKFTKIKV